MLEQNSNKRQKQKITASELPPIPDKLYFTIGEVSKLCRLKPHVLRYWEQEFPLLKPTKRRGNRRYYQLKDVKLIRQIRSLLYDQGFTIEGARLQLGSQITKPTQETVGHKTQEFLKQTVAYLETVLTDLEEAS